MELDSKKLPTHVAIIMDGNGRWAEGRKLDRTQGHVEGVKRVEEIVAACHEWGIKYLTLYTFSTENWNRPATEVNVLMNLLVTVINSKIKKLKEDNTRFQIIGRRERIPDSVYKAMEFLKEETKDNDGVTLSLAFNYGARLEIMDGFREIMQDIEEKKLRIDQVCEQTISQHLYTRNMPDPDLLIRTSGEKRISNFLLWQLSYAEFYFADTLWPDFNKQEFKKAILDYQQRDRRFGAVSGQKF